MEQENYIIGGTTCQDQKIMIQSLLSQDYL
jgi:hypothetical protein